MITKTQARTYQDAFNMCDGHTFALAWNDAADGGQRPIDYKTGLSGYAHNQFHMMQTQALDFIVKWPMLAARIVEIHNGD